MSGPRPLPGSSLRTRPSLLRGVVPWHPGFPTPRELTSILLGVWKSLPSTAPRGCSPGVGLEYKSSAVGVQVLKDAAGALAEIPTPAALSRPSLAEH